MSPWSVGRTAPGAQILPEEVTDAIYRIARYPSSLTDGWYQTQLELGIDPFAYVEMVGVVVAVVVAVAAVDGFYRAAGLERPPLPTPLAGVPSGKHPHVERATLNWVPVAAPADRTAAVVQGLSAAPGEVDNVARLAAAQYIPFEEMGELGWSRGTLSRSEMELVAAAVGDDAARAEVARAAIVHRLGADWLVDASAVIANFEMMTRPADGTGARLRPEQIIATASIRENLGLDAFPSARR